MRISFVVLLFCFPLIASAQSEIVLGALAQGSVTYKASDRWKLAGKAEMIHIGWNKSGEAPLLGRYTYLRSDLSLIGTYRLSSLVSLGGGYLIRMAGDGPRAHRTIQQLGIVTLGSALRLGHRVRLDQTFTDGEDVEVRIRYRLSAELPLQGLSLNIAEWYAIGSIEQLAALHSGVVDWEQRLTAGLGRYFNAGNKLEMGVDYRLDKLIRENGRHRLWLALSYYVNL